MVDAKDLEDIQKDIAGEEFQQKITDVNILFLDLSSTCTGYCVVKVNFETKKATFSKAGALWLDPNWKHQDKYHYIYEAIVNYFWIIEQIDYIVAEQYSINPKKSRGLHVSPEMHGVVKVAAAANGVNVSTFTPQSWRYELGIKPDVTVVKGKTKKDYKTPTKRKMLEYVAIPEDSISNITNNKRKTPSDVYDAMGLGAGWLKRFGITRWDFSKMEFNQHIGVIDG